MRVKNFSKSKVSLRLPYLLALQKESWQWFLEEGLKELKSTEIVVNVLHGGQGEDEIHGGTGGGGGFGGRLHRGGVRGGYSAGVGVARRREGAGLYR